MHCLHRTVLLSVGAREHRSICKRSTSSEAYHHQGDTSSSHMAHITICGIPGWASTDCEWPKWWKVFHLGENPSLQVCCRTRGSKSHAFVSGELAGWIEKTRSWQDADMQTSHSPNCARILGNVVHFGAFALYM